MNILITGGCGFVGTVLTAQLLQDGHQITVVDTQWFGNHLKPHPRLTVLKQDTRDVNSIPARLKSAAGLTILVPSRDRDPNLQATVAPAPAVAASEPAPAQPARSRSHVVRPGETLSALAQRYGVTPQQLAAWNGLKANRIVAGQKLELSAPMQAVAARPAAKAAPAGPHKR